MCPERLPPDSRSNGMEQQLSSSEARFIRSASYLARHAATGIECLPWQEAFRPGSALR